MKLRGHEHPWYPARAQDDFAGRIPTRRPEPATTPPLVHQVRVHTERLRHTRYRRPRLITGGQNLLLELRAVTAPTLAAGCFHLMSI